MLHPYTAKYAITDFIFVWFTISLNCDIISLSEMGPCTLRDGMEQLRNWLFIYLKYQFEKNKTMFSYLISYLNIEIVQFVEIHKHESTNVSNFLS